MSPLSICGIVPACAVTMLLAPAAGTVAVADWREPAMSARLLRQAMPTSSGELRSGGSPIGSRLAYVACGALLSRPENLPCALFRATVPGNALSS